ncbi:ABC transporter ATP-binding protein, partial [bacterium]|nr:ABC transporter ATP-binding protein [bacterium]
MSKNRRKPSKKGFKILLKYLFKYKKEIILLSFLGVISGFANAAVPYIVGSFFDAILDVSKMVEYFDYTIPLWVAFVVLFGIIQIFANLSDWIIDKRGKRIA